MFLLPFATTHLLIQQKDPTVAGFTWATSDFPIKSVELWGRFAVYVPPLTEKLALAELEHGLKSNRM